MHGIVRGAGWAGSEGPLSCGTWHSAECGMQALGRTGAAVLCLL